MKQETPQLSDKELVELYKRTEEPDYFGKLYKRYVGEIKGVCYKYLHNTEKAADEAQEIFKKIYGKKLMQQKEIRHFRSWLLRVALNHCLDILKSAGYKHEQKTFYIDEIEKKLKEPEADDMHSEGPDRLDVLLEKERILDELERCLALLSPEQRECIERFYYQDQSYQTIADEIVFTEEPADRKEKVRSYIQNGRRNLKICIEQNQSL